VPIAFQGPFIAPKDRWAWSGWMRPSSGSPPNRTTASTKLRPVCVLGQHSHWAKRDALVCFIEVGFDKVALRSLVLDHHTNVRMTPNAPVQRAATDAEGGC
jgi:hypothetical protein